MFGAFQASKVNQSGLLWKTPWRLSPTRKANQRKRLKRVDSVIEAVQASGVKCSSLATALQLPKEPEMPPRDKYTVFNAKSVGYRKGIHKVPKWTRISQRLNPRGF
ncbi:60s ribosomal protein l31 [Gautieria morchelliformis]|nr:60s ribosomal protein l31 [Gautieria morchelliformis]